MKTIVYLGLMIRVIFLFGASMLFTFIPDELREFFGDTIQSYSAFEIDPQWRWGARHRWYFVMCVCLFLISAANVIVGCVNIVNKWYPNLK